MIGTRVIYLLFVHRGLAGGCGSAFLSVPDLLYSHLHEVEAISQPRYCLSYKRYVEEKAEAQHDSSEVIRSDNKLVFSVW